MKRRKRIQTNCSGCGCAMESGRWRAPWYCDACREATKKFRRAAAWRRWAEKRGMSQGALDPVPCKHCGTVFERQGQQFNMRYCGVLCAQAAARDSHRERQRAKRESERSAPQLSDRELERRMQAYFERQGWAA